MTGKPSAPRSDGGDRRQGSSKTTAPERMESNRALSSPADFPSYLQDCAPPAKRGTKRRVELFSDARKRPRTSPHLSPVEEAGDKLASNKHPTNPIDFWTRRGHWPKEYFEVDYFELNSFEPDDGMAYALARKKSQSFLSLSPSNSAISQSTPSDQKPRSQKGVPYKDTRYATLLSTKGSFLFRHSQGITDVSKIMLKARLLQARVDGTAVSGTAVASTALELLMA